MAKIYLLCQDSLSSEAEEEQGTNARGKLNIDKYKLFSGKNATRYPEALLKYWITCKAPAR